MMKHNYLHLGFFCLASVSDSLETCSSGTSYNYNFATSSMETATRVARAAVAQLRSTSDKHSNLINVAKCAGWAKRAGAKMLFLPECLGFMGDNAGHTLEQADPTLNDCDIEYKNEEHSTSSLRKILSHAILAHAEGTLFDRPSIDDMHVVTSIVNELRFIARESALWISCGGIHTTVPPSSSKASLSLQDKKIYNTHIIIDDKGQIVSHYHKIHLFDVSIPNKVQLQESKTTQPGTQLVLCDSPVGKLGLSICYDVRFSEMYVDLVKRGAQVLLVPSAFTVPTGKAHWHALLKARAIESQCFVIAAAQVGRHNDKRESYGHSLAYDPWGNLVADAGGYDGFGTVGDTASPSGEDSPVNAPSIILCDVNLEQLDSVRESMPIQQHRESALFSF